MEKNLKKNTYVCIYFLVIQWRRIHLPMQEMQLRSLSGEDPLEEEMATHSSILARKIPWTKEPGHGVTEESDTIATEQHNIHVCITKSLCCTPEANTTS